MSALEDWLAEVAIALDVDTEAVDVTQLLGVTRDIAHNVARPAGPLTTFLIGLALGRHGGGLDQARTLTAMVQRLALEHEPLPEVPG